MWSETLEFSGLLTTAAGCAMPDKRLRPLDVGEIVGGNLQSGAAGLFYSGTADPREMVAQSIGRLGAERKAGCVDEAKAPPYRPYSCHSNQLYNSHNPN